MKHSDERTEMSQSVIDGGETAPAADVAEIAGGVTDRRNEIIDAVTEWLGEVFDFADRNGSDALYEMCKMLDVESSTEAAADILAALRETAQELLPCPFCGNDGSGPIEDALHVCHTESDYRSQPRDMYSMCRR
jgi:hypothetical protein